MGERLEGRGGRVIGAAGARRGEGGGLHRGWGRGRAAWVGVVVEVVALAYLRRH